MAEQSFRFDVFVKREGKTMWPRQASERNGCNVLWWRWTIHNTSVKERRDIDGRRLRQTAGRRGPRQGRGACRTHVAHFGFSFSFAFGFGFNFGGIRSMSIYYNKQLHIYDSITSFTNTSISIRIK